jgi:hypothetical protein
MDKYLKCETPPEQSHYLVFADGDLYLDDDKVLAVKTRTKTMRTDNKSPKRKCDESYLKFGFNRTDPEDKRKPLRVLCSAVLTSACKKKSNLMRRHKTKHSQTITKPTEFSGRKRDQMKPQQLTSNTVVTINSTALRATFEVSLRSAKSKKPHTIAEELIFPSAIDMVKAVPGDSLANNTIGGRISAMSDDVNEQIIIKLKTSKMIAVQLDVPTDVASCSILAVCVCFVNPANTVTEKEVLLSEKLL